MWFSFKTIQIFFFKLYSIYIEMQVAASFFFSPSCFISGIKVFCNIKIILYSLEKNICEIINVIYVSSKLFFLFVLMWSFNLSCHLPSGFQERFFLLHCNKKAYWKKKFLWLSIWAFMFSPGNFSLIIICHLKFWLVYFICTWKNLYKSLLGMFKVIILLFEIPY